MLLAVNHITALSISISPSGTGFHLCGSLLRWSPSQSQWPGSEGGGGRRRPPGSTWRWVRCTVCIGELLALAGLQSSTLKSKLLHKHNLSITWTWTNVNFGQGLRLFLTSKACKYDQRTCLGQPTAPPLSCCRAEFSHPSFWWCWASWPGLSSPENILYILINC